MNKIVFLSVVFTSNICLVFSDFRYPSVRRDDTISDDYFGTKVKDPYRWLENPDSVETKKFVSEENKITRDYLDTNKYRSNISQSFHQLYNFPKYDGPLKAGSKYYYLANTGLQNQSIYYSIDSIDSNKSKVFIDPNQLSSDGTTSVQLLSFSKDGKYCTYGISKGGSDWMTIRIKNTQTLKDLPETLTKIKFTSTEWTQDGLGFFYAQYDEYNGTANGTESKAPKNHKLFYHKINTNQTEDIKILAFPERPNLLISSSIISDDGKYLHVFGVEGTSGNLWYFAKLESTLNSLNFKPVIKNLDIQYNYLASKENLVYVRTNRNASNFRLIRVDINKPQEYNWVDILPEDKKSVLKNAVVVNKTILVAVYMRDVVDVIQIHSLIDGKLIKKLDTPIGTVSYIQAPINGTEIFYKIVSFLQPGTIYRYDLAQNHTTIKTFKESKIAGFNASDYETKMVFYRSKDGSVSVPMLLVHRKGIKQTGSNPTLLYAYGGFGISYQPYFEPMATFFIKNLNGIFAFAYIRGGGELGDNWHRAGMRTNKTKGFDDFAYAAEYLISNNYTQRDRLTIWGQSNGGLLVGATSNRRPDLYGCALPEVGVMDMLRFPLFTGGFFWQEEYGYPRTNKTDFEYSPVHSIPENATQYPATLIQTGDHDDRVTPGVHSYKFAAQLQHLLGSKLRNTPLMIRIDTNAGHGGGKPISKWINEYTDYVTFILNSLKINYQNI